MTLYVFLWSLITINFILIVVNYLILKRNRQIGRKLLAAIDDFNKNTSTLRTKGD